MGTCWRESVTFDASGVEITMNPFFLGWKWRPSRPFYSVESKSFHSRQNKRSEENFPPNETRKLLLLLLLYFFVHTFSVRSSRLLPNTFSASLSFDRVHCFGCRKPFLVPSLLADTHTPLRNKMLMRVKMLLWCCRFSSG